VSVGANRNAIAHKEIANMAAVMGLRDEARPLLGLGEVADTSFLRSREDYARQLEAILPRDLFRPVPTRLWWLLVHAAIVSACAYAILRFDVIAVRLLASLVLGHSLGTLGFLGHEVMHGTVVRNRLLVKLIGGACTLHWGIAPWLWIARHNRLHHQHTNDPFGDPDCFADEALYERSAVIRWLNELAPGSGTLRSYGFLFFWFTFSFGLLAFAYPLFRRRHERWTARIYFVATHAAWALAAAQIAGGLVWLMLVPIAVSNFVMMIYVATNHALSPLTRDRNDPLMNSLTVRSTWWIEALHLQTAFHVEHHLLPHVNPSHAPRVAEIVKARWPDAYQEMDHLSALVMLYRTPRVYRTETLLVHPRTQRTAPTLLAGHYEARRARTP
jgi:fatty acid desaturase